MPKWRKNLQKELERREKEKISISHNHNEVSHKENIVLGRAKGSKKPIKIKLRRQRKSLSIKAQKISLNFNILPKIDISKYNVRAMSLVLLVLTIFTGQLLSYHYKEISAQDLRPESLVPSSTILGASTSQPNQRDVNSSFKTVDIREYVFNEYFKLHNSPLYGHANLFTEACDRFGAPKDCISTVAIAKHETNLCNYHNSAKMYNCMGWGGGGEHRMAFTSFKEHIDIATDVLVNQYGVRYMNDPRLMERVFCGPQAECDNWGNRILYIMEEIDVFAESLGVGRLTNLR